MVLTFRLVNEKLLLQILHLVVVASSTHGGGTSEYVSNGAEVHEYQHSIQFSVHDQ